MAELTYLEAIQQGIDEEMARDERVFVLGEDVGAFGGAFKVTHGLQARYGESRVIDTPIAETAIVGVAAGAAHMGLRPVAEMQFIDFISCAYSILTNYVATARYRADLLTPMVVRGPAGGYVRGGPFHSQNPEAAFLHTPGLKIVCPATARDAKGLIKSAIRDNNPVIFFEHKKLYEETGPVPEEDYTIPLGKADVKRPGRDVTLVTYAYMVGKSLAAAELLAKEGIDVEVVDLLSVSPMDEEAIVASVKKTHRLVVVQETWKRCSISSEVAAIAAEQALDYLDAPILRVTAHEVPTPFSPVLEEFVLPNEGKIVDAVRRVVAA